VVPTSGQRQAVNGMPAVSQRGAFLYKGTRCKRAASTPPPSGPSSEPSLRDHRQPVFVVDGHPANRARLIAAFVPAKRGHLELHLHSGYAPDLNPDEFVWNPLRQQGVTKTPLRQNEFPRDRVDADLAVIKADRPLDPDRQFGIHLVLRSAQCSLPSELD